MQLAPFCHRSPTGYLKAKTQGALLDTGKPPQFQPDARYPLCPMLLSLLFKYLNQVLAQGKLMHTRRL